MVAISKNLIRGRRITSPQQILRNADEGRSLAWRHGKGDYAIKPAADKLSAAITALVNQIERWAQKKTAAVLQEQKAEANLSASLQELQDKYNEKGLTSQKAAK